MANFNPAYTATKNSGTVLTQVIAENADPDKMQVVSLHPGVAHTDGIAAAGITQEMLAFDDGQ